jgi:hypothetical protein
VLPDPADFDHGGSPFFDLGDDLSGGPLDLARLKEGRAQSLFNFDQQINGGGA